MDYLERKYKGKRKEKVFNIIYCIFALATMVVAGLLIFGFLKKDIVNRNLLFFLVFFLGFIMCIMLAIRCKNQYKYSRMIWIIIEAIVLLILSIIVFLILV